MKRVYYEPFTVVEVTWVDAMAAGGNQYTSIAEALAGYKPTFRKTSGYFVGYATTDGEPALILCNDDDRTPNTPESLGGIMQTPMGMVRAINPVGEIKKRKRTRKSS